MLLPALEPDRNRAAQIATWAILGGNALLLAVSLPDYRVSIDSGYHISLAEVYAAHGNAWWDHINFGPGGRPNLQGPALHIAIAILGKILGGTPDRFILANAILAIAQWGAAMLTVLYFARRLGGDMAAMFAVAMLAGSAFAAGSFYVGIPSGWLFISIPWAIYFFLEDRLVLATAITVLGCYTHLGGFLSAPVGIAIAAVIERRWRSLCIVAVATALLTAPYSIHFLNNLAWYRGQHGHESLRLDPMIDLLAIAGAVVFLRRPMRHRFLFAWALAPVAWLLQDPGRFAAQSTLAGSVLGGLLLAWAACSISFPAARRAFAIAIVAIATLLPLEPASIFAEAGWDAGTHFPRMLDWNRARTIAAVIERNHLSAHLLAVYQNSFGPCIAVFTPVVLERGHWVEVQPLHDPAELLSADMKAYVMPLAPNDPVLEALSRQGFVHVWGGTDDTAVVTLARRADPAEIEPMVSQTLQDDANWLAANAINNTMPPLSALARILVSPAALADRRALMDIQRFKAGEMQAVTLVIAYAVEPQSADLGRTLRLAARGFAEMGSFMSDDDPMGDIGADREARFRANMAAFASALRAAGPAGFSDPVVHAATERLFNDYYGGAA
jgi:hypothetical protein